MFLIVVLMVNVGVHKAKAGEWTSKCPIRRQLKCCSSSLWCRQQIVSSLVWCCRNKLSLSTHRTKETVRDLRRHRVELAPAYINGDLVERVYTFRFLGIHTSEDLLSGQPTLCQWSKVPAEAMFKFLWFIPFTEYAD